MRKAKGQEYLLKCSHEGCKAEITLKIETNPPGFLPYEEFEKEAKKKGWHASMVERNHVFCPKHSKGT